MTGIALCLKKLLLSIKKVKKVKFDQILIMLFNLSTFCLIFLFKQAH